MACAPETWKARDEKQPCHALLVESGRATRGVLQRWHGQNPVGQRKVEGGVESDGRHFVHVALNGFVLAHVFGSKGRFPIKPGDPAASEVIVSPR